MSTIFDLFSFFIFLTSFHMMAASDNMKDDELGKGAHSDRGALWFGPRLGKRSLQFVDEDNSQPIMRLLEAADALKYYYNQMPYEMQADAPQTKVTKKIIFTPKLGRASDPQDKKFENVQFTPRLGRKLAEKKTIIPTVEEENYGQNPLIESPHYYNFSPRLGRNFEFSPRLGRELVYDMILEPKIRIARSVNKTKSTQH